MLLRSLISGLRPSDEVPLAGASSVAALGGLIGGATEPALGADLGLGAFSRLRRLVSAARANYSGDNSSDNSDTNNRSYASSSSNSSTDASNVGVSIGAGNKRRSANRESHLLLGSQQQASADAAAAAANIDDLSKATSDQQPNAIAKQADANNNQTTKAQTQSSNSFNKPADDGHDWQLKRKYTLKEVQQHASLDDCWMVIFDKVYNITEFVDEHPGGDYILLEYAGRDATHPFLSSRHGSSAYKMLDKYWIGILVDEELYYSNHSSYCSVYTNLSWRSAPPSEASSSASSSDNAGSVGTAISAHRASISASSIGGQSLSTDSAVEEVDASNPEVEGEEVAPEAVEEALATATNNLAQEVLAEQERRDLPGLVTQQNHQATAAANSQTKPAMIATKHNPSSSPSPPPPSAATATATAATAVAASATISGVSDGVTGSSDFFHSSCFDYCPDCLPI